MARRATALTASCAIFVMVLVLVASSVLEGAEKDGRLDIYWTDVEGGAATLIVTPAGESVLIDTGLPGERDPGRILKTVTETAGLRRIDHLVVTHFDRDHYGGTADIMANIEVGDVYDPGLPADNPKVIEAIQPYILATAGKRQVLQPGETISLGQRADEESASFKLTCLAANQKFIEAREDQKKENPHCAKHEPADKDLSQNANSVVLVLDFGPFRFLDAADLTWNLEQELVCPHNLVGTVDVFQIDHHGLSSSNNPVLLASVEPEVVIMNNGSVKGNSLKTHATVKGTPSVKAVYQLHRNIRSGPEGNTFPRRIANIHAECKAEIIQLSVARDGKSYDVIIPAKNLVETFETKTK